MMGDRFFNIVMMIYFFIISLIYFLGAIGFKLNPIFLTLFFITFFFLKLRREVILYLMFFLPFFLFVTINTNFNSYYTFMHFIQDAMMVGFIFSICSYICYDELSKKEQLNIFYFSIIYIVLYVLSSLDTSRFDMELGIPRYNGITGSTNISSTTFILLLIYVWEFFKQNNRQNKLIFWGVVFLYVVAIYLSKSRSLLLFLPYCFFQFYIVYYNFYQRIIMLLLIGIGVLLVAYNLDYIFESLRISSDSSFNTREKISRIILEGISDNYYFIPHGHNSGNVFLATYLNEERYPIHNDFLKILYEWGISGVIFVSFSFAKVFLHVRTLNDLLILFFAISSALHNVLFFFYIWIPLLFIFCMKNYYRK